MKVGIEVQRLFRPQKFGIEVSALQMIKKLQQLYKGCEFVIYAKDDADRKCLSESPNLKIRTVAGKMFVDFEQIFLPIAAKSDKVDLLHCTGNTTPLFCSVPVVQTLHDVIFMDPISGNDTMYQRFGNHYRRVMVPATTRKSHAVITVSEYEKKRILERVRMDERKLRVIYNGIDDERFNNRMDVLKMAEVKKRYALPEKFILFLGNTSARKNSTRVIEAYCMYAARTAKPLPIVTPGLPQTYIERELDRLGQSEKRRLFISTGYLPDGDLAPLYRLSTVFLFPSLSEGFGMPLIEAMACGTPVITSNVSSLPEIAGGAGMLVDPASTASICEALTALLVNEDLRLTKVDQGLRNARRFSWTKTAEQVFEVYEQVCYHPGTVLQASAKISYELR